MQEDQSAQANAEILASLPRLSHLVKKTFYDCLKAKWLVFKIGKFYCRRHEDYKKGGKTRGDLAFQVHFGPFSEEQQDKIMEVLTNMFRCRRNKYFDYVSKVLLPETLVALYMKVESKTREEVWIISLFYAF